MVARNESWDGEVGLVARIRAQCEAAAAEKTGQTERRDSIRRVSGLGGQESGKIGQVSSDVEAMKRRLERLRQLYPELAGVGISEYVEALSSKSTAEVK